MIGEAEWGVYFVGSRAVLTVVIVIRLSSQS
jgi:hypothetical protein